MQSPGDCERGYQHETRRRGLKCYPSLRRLALELWTITLRVCGASGSVAADRQRHLRNGQGYGATIYLLDQLLDRIESAFFSEANVLSMIT